MENESNSKFDLQDIAGKLWSVKWRILAFQAVVFVGCVGVILFWPRTYRSEARIFLQLGRETVSIDPTATTGQMIGIQQSSREDEIVSAMEVLKSRGLIGEVVTKLTPEVVLGHVGLDEDSAEGKGQSSPVADYVKGMVGSVVDQVKQIDPMSDFERAVTLIEKNMKVDAERKSEVIVVEYEAESPKLAQRVVDTMVKTYKDAHARLHRTEGSKTFFDSQQELLQKELEAVNESLRLAKNRMGLASIDGERQNLESRSREISQNMSDTERSLFEIQAKLANLKLQLETRPERIASAEVQKPNNATDLQAQQLYALQLIELEYKSKYNDGHPKLLTIRAQVEEAEAKLKLQSDMRSETTDDVNPIHRELTLEYVKAEATEAGLKERFATLERQHQDILERIRTINGYEVEVADLEREARLREKKYLAYSESFEQARVDQALESDKISSVSIAQEATLQEKPITPSKLLVILFGLMSMVAGGGCIGLASVKLDDRLTTPASVRNRLGVPVLVTIPKSRVFSQIRAQR